MHYNKPIYISTKNTTHSTCHLSPKQEDSTADPIKVIPSSSSLEHTQVQYVPYNPIVLATLPPSSFQHSSNALRRNTYLPSTRFSIPLYMHNHHCVGKPYTKIKQSPSLQHLHIKAYTAFLQKHQHLLLVKDPVSKQPSLIKATNARKPRIRKEHPTTLHISVRSTA
jgi:hypothetical protein